MAYQAGAFLSSTLDTEQRKYDLTDELQMSTRRVAPVLAVLVGEFKKRKAGDPEFKTLGDREPVMSGTATGVGVALTTSATIITIASASDYLGVGDLLAFDKYQANNSNTSNLQARPEIMRITSINSTTVTVTRNIEAVGTATYNLSTAAAATTLAWQRIGSAQGENTDPRTAKQYAAYSTYNYIQIGQRTYEISDVTSMTDHFGPDELTRQQKIALIEMNRGIEGSIIYGTRAENFEDGKPVRSTAGALWHLDQADTNLGTQAYASAYDLVTGDGASRIWRPGDEFNKAKFEKFITETFMYGSDSRLGVHGKDFIRHLKAEFDDQIRLERTETTYGVRLLRYESNEGEVYFLYDPEMDVIGPRDLYCLDTQYLSFKTMKDLHTRKVASERGPKKEWLVYFGLEMNVQNAHSAILGMSEIAL